MRFRSLSKRHVSSSFLGEVKIQPKYVRAVEVICTHLSLKATNIESQSSSILY